MPTKTVIPVDEFKRRLVENSIEFIFDLRHKDEFEGWKIEGKTDIPTMNIPQEDFVGEEDKFYSRFPKDKEIITVCAHGDSSKYSAELLQAQGLRAMGLEGGMDLWSEYYDTHKVSSDPLIYQIYRLAKGCMTHVVISDGKAIVIDAVRHTDHIMKVVNDNRAKVVAILDTHLQADHISGGMDIAAKTGAPYWINTVDADGAAYKHEHLKDGIAIDFGKCRLAALHTPGHTPGSTSFLLNDKYLFTGDTIMKTSIGRPDLGGMVREWAALLYDTLFGRMRGLKDDIIILPTHAVSIKEWDSAGVVSLTMGDARGSSDLYQIRDQAAFTKHIEATLLENPERYQDIRKVNLGVLKADEKKLKEFEIGKNLCGMGGPKAPLRG